MTERPDVASVRAHLVDLQDRICAALEAEDGSARFREERFESPAGGLARPRVLEGGSVLEKSAVLFSHTIGKALPAAATERRPELAGRVYEAVSVSLIVHPRNPYAPTSHMNTRFFIAYANSDPPEEGNLASGAASGGGARSEPKASEAHQARRGRGKPDRSGRLDAGPIEVASNSLQSSHAVQGDVWWFGGGFDLTPYYGFEEDAVHWHRTARTACEGLGADAYPRFKKWCDEYFFLPHRGEPRGVGGLFFDDLDAPDFSSCFAFWKRVGDHYLPAYLPILQRRKATPYGEREREFQLYRRGRYAEFNLVHDRGTRFGLESGGRVESILASLPPLAAWRYDWKPEPGTPEARLYTDFLRPRDWA